MVFRGDARAPRPLHPLEKALLVFTALHLIFLPWAFGGMTKNPWTVWVSLVFSLTGFTLALINRHYTEVHAREGEFDLVMWPKLVRFPIFWLGLILLTYMAIGNLNPALQYVGTGTTWTIVNVAHIRWLPSGLDAPFTDMNGWRLILIYVSPWLTVCSLWVGITRRYTVLALLSTLALNGAALALLGILERVAPNDKIFWLVHSPNGHFVSSFVYKNHAGAYFNLMLAVSCALVQWNFARNERRMDRANPAPIFAFCAVLTGLIVLLSYARMATVLLMLFIVVAATGAIIRQIRVGTEGRRPFVVLLLGVVLLLFVGGGVVFLDHGQSLEHMEELASAGQSMSVEGRELAARATWEMAKDNLVTGWGAGSFYHYFPMYQQRYPFIYSMGPGRPNWNWEYAHNDYLQILAELGLVGAGIFVAGAVYWGCKFFQYGIYERPHALVLMLGLALLMLNSWTDLQLYCPAILVTWCVLWLLTARWIEFEDNRIRD